MRFISFLFAFSAVLSQATLKGTIKDEAGKPIEFTNIYIKHTMLGATTAADGSFEFQIPNLKHDTLVASYIGYKEVMVKIPNDGKTLKRFELALKEDIKREDIVTITASAYVTDVDKRVVVAKPLDVVTTPGAAADINRFFQTLPGVTSVDEGAGLFVRGGNVQETVMEIDGATILHPYKFESPSGGFFGTISPFLTKGSAFFTGALSAEYGNVLSGMVDMQSTGLVEANAYNVGIGLAALSARVDQVVLRDEMSFSMSGNYSDTEAMMTLNNHRTDFPKFPRNYDINMNMNMRLGKKHTAKFFWFQESNEVGAEVVQPELKLFYEGKATNNLSNLMLQGALTERLAYRANIAHTSYENKNAIGAGGGTQEDNMLQFKFRAEQLVGELSSISFGADLRRLSYEYNGNWHFHPDSVTQGRAGFAFAEEHELDYLGLFTEFKLPVNKELLFRVGLRMEQELESEEAFLDPRLIVAYQASEYLSLSASYGVYHQLPALNYYLNNQAIEMQRSEGATLGAHYEIPSALILRGEVYYKEYDQLIKKIGASDEQRFNNTGYGYSTGFDLLAKQKFSRGEYWLSYSYVKARRNELYFVKLASPDFDITHNVTVVGKYNIQPNIMIGGKYVWRTGKPYTSSPILLEQNKNRLPHYARLDLNLSYITQLFKSDQTIFYISFSNLFGRENVLNRRYTSDYSQHFDETATFKRGTYFGMNIKF